MYDFPKILIESTKPGRTDHTKSIRNEKNI